MKHHPCGPSSQKHFDICCGYQPSHNDHENKVLGSICHKIWETDDHTLADNLPDPDGALAQVDKIGVAWRGVVSSFCDEYGGLVSLSNEAFLEVPGLNFGICDRLRIAGEAALIGDAKFGAWAVDHAEVNLQGHNYAVLVWILYPKVEDVWVWFGNPFLEDYSLAKFTRKKDFFRMHEFLEDRLRAAADPDPAKFNYDELNCSFCSRLECPAREKVATQVVEYLEDRDPLNMNLEELNNIKKLTNSLKTLTKLVDDEVKARVLDNGESLEDFVIKERVHSRNVIGMKNIAKLTELLWGLVGDIPGLGDIPLVSFSDVEQLIVHSVGTYREAKPIISKLVEELEAAKALTTNRYYIVATKNESEKNNL